MYFEFNKKRFLGLKIAIEFSKKTQIDVIYIITRLHNFIIYYLSDDKKDI